MSTRRSDPAEAPKFDKRPKTRLSGQDDRPAVGDDPPGTSKDSVLGALDVDLEEADAPIGRYEIIQSLALHFNLLDIAGRPVCTKTAETGLPRVEEKSHATFLIAQSDLVDISH